MRKFFKKTLSAILIAFLAFTMMPQQILAADGQGPDAGAGGSESPFVIDEDARNVTEAEAKKVDLNDWMAALPDDWLISEINMPGTHDAGTKYCSHIGPSVATWIWCQCQDYTIDDQLDRGTRVLDIRLNYEKGEWDDTYICHGDFDLFTGAARLHRLKLKDVVKHCEDFLAKHDQEAVFVLLSPDRHEDATAKKMEDMKIYAREHSDKFAWYEANDKVPTLKKVRGKIVFVDDYKKRATTDYENDYWEKSYYDSTTYKENLVRKALDDAKLQSFFLPRTAEGKKESRFLHQKDKIRNVEGKEGEPVVKCVYSSANGYKEGADFLKWPKSPQNFADAMNENGIAFQKYSILDGTTWQYPWKKGTRYGWMMMDYPNLWVVRKVIATNNKSIYDNKVYVTVEDPDGVFGDLHKLKMHGETLFGEKRVDSAKTTWLSENQFVMEGMPAWPGKTKVRYFAALDLPAGWTYTYHRVEDKDGYESWVYTLHAPKPASVTVNWDCYPDHKDLLKQLTFTADCASDDQNVRSVQVVSDSTGESVLNVQFDHEPVTGSVVDLSVNIPSGSSVKYDKKSDYRRTDNKHYSFTLHVDAEYKELSGKIEFIDGDNYRDSRPRFANDFWKRFRLTGSTADGSYKVDQPIVISEADAKKNVINWNNSVPKNAPSGKTLEWALSNADPLKGYTRKFDPNGLDVTYELQRYIGTGIEWKNDTPDMRPEDVRVKACRMIDGRKVTLASSFPSKVRGWVADFSLMDADSEITLEVDETDLPEGYKVTKTTLYNFGTNFEITWNDNRHTITAKDCYADKESAFAGETVNIVADSSFAPDPEKVFGHWEVSDGVKLQDPDAGSTSFVMPDQDVTIKAVYVSKKHSVRVTNGRADKTKAEAGEWVALEADPAPEGSVFDHWEEINQSIDKFEVRSGGWGFIMPDCDVNVQAVYEGAQMFSVMVDNGTADKTLAEAGETVAVTADDLDGATFKGWRVIEGDVSLAAPSDPQTSFIMPEENVKLEAVFDNFNPLPIHVIGGTASQSAAAAGTSVFISADEPAAGEVFKEWKVITGGASVADSDQAETTFTMPDKEVTIQAVFAKAPKYSITVRNGEAAVSEAMKGETVGIKAVVPPGKEFQGWGYESGNCDIEDQWSPETFITMYDQDVTLIALLEDVKYNVDVEKGTAAPSAATYGEKVKLHAGAADAGTRFVKWEVVSGDVQLADETDPDTTFSMPAENVKLKAVYEKKKYTVEVVNGTSDVSEALFGQKVSLTADPAPSGKKFDHWEKKAGYDVDFEDPKAADTEFIMPDVNVKVEAVYSDIPTETYPIHMNNGTASHRAAREGELVTLTADPAPEGKTFYYWMDTRGEVTFKNEDAASTSFRMPADEVWITAVYGKALHRIHVAGGSADHTAASIRDKVSLKADPAPEGKEFACWMDTYGNILYDDPTNSETTFVMPGTDVWIQAVYKSKDIPADEHTITMIDGTADYLTAAEGVKVTITAANIPEGKIFDRWKVVEGGAVPADASSAVTTFRMPAADVTIKALFKDAPVVYHIIEGDGSTWTKGSRKTQRFVSDAPFKKYASVKVDGKTVPKKFLKVTKGFKDTTVVDLAPEYMESLAKGGHTIEVIASDGSASATFKVVSGKKDPVGPKKPTDPDVDTGDAGRIGLCLLLMAVSLAFACAAGRKRRRE